MMLKEIQYGMETIQFDLQYRDKKHMTINVLPDMNVEVVAPRDWKINVINERVRKRAKWILKQKQYFLGFLPKQPPREYVSGETHMYRGRQYRLRLKESKYDEVRLKGGFFEVKTTDKNNKEHNRTLLYQWYKDSATKVFFPMLDQWIEKLRKYDIASPVLEIRIMTKRWGSCIASKGKVILNLELIKAPTHCIEYILVHELCHLKYPSHDKEFYNFMLKVMPDWKEKKGRLEGSLL